jgi:hypothetical protein
MIGLVVVVLSLIAAPQFALSATPLSFVKLHPDGLGLLAASDDTPTFKVSSSYLASDSARLRRLRVEEKAGNDALSPGNSNLSLLGSVGSS